ncbi:MAG TPA: hypothetical protein VGM34_00915 [Chlamydiales bacterium]
MSPLGGGGAAAAAEPALEVGEEFVPKRFLFAKEPIPCIGAGEPAPPKAVAEAGLFDGEVLGVGSVDIAVGVLDPPPPEALLDGR